MAFTSGFFNSYKGDRKYNAEQVSEIFDGVLADGIIPSQGQLFDVNTANNGMQITVGTGRAWFDHTWSKNDSIMVLTVEVSDITRPRYDTVVLEVNHNDEVRQNSIKIVKGVAAVNADKPILLNTDKVKQYPLAHILVRAGTDEIRAADIENMVGREPTVFATGVLETVPIDDLWSQWKGEWDDWFANIKLQLSGDIVTNLQYQIDMLKEQCLLSDETKALMGFDSKSTNDDAIAYILTKMEMIAKGKAMATITVTAPNFIKPSGLLVSGMQTTTGGAVYTNASGVATGLINAGNVTLSINTGYADVNSISKTYNNVVAGDVITDTWTLSFIDYRIFGSSTSIKFSPYCKRVDVALCGGGGGGGATTTTSSYGKDCGSSAGGGGGGYTAEKTNVEFSPNTNYQVVVGAGGAAGDLSAGSNDEGLNGAAGGTSSFLGVSANGGGGGQKGQCANSSHNTISASSGGSGNGRGGSGIYVTNAQVNDNVASTAVSRNGNAGVAGTGYIYLSSSATVIVGGGGGGGAFCSNYKNVAGSATGGAGGSPNGGSGSDVSVSTAGLITNTTPSSGRTYGGGGGGIGLAYVNYPSSSTNYHDYYHGNTRVAGKGASGAVSIRMIH